MDTVLGNMGMNLTEEELKDLTQNLPSDGEHLDITEAYKKNKSHMPVADSH